MKKIVVKIGSGVLTDENGFLDEKIIAGIADQIKTARDSKKQILLVTSGAIAAGMAALKTKKRPVCISDLQAIASIGQTLLMDTYNRYFKEKQIVSGQILVTQDDFDDRRRYLNIKYTIDTLLAHGAIPIINENDTISTEEIKCGDNDRLSALVADMVGAEQLIILSNVDGLMDKSGKLVKCVASIDKAIKEMSLDKKSCSGTGGMVTKIEAVEFCTNSGIECFIANGKKKSILADVLERKGLYSYFSPKKNKVNAKKRWISFGSKIKGKVLVDSGAEKALIEKQKSLLPVGVIDVKGKFTVGDTISICSQSGKEFARGLTSYSSAEILKIKGAKTERVKQILDVVEHEEIVHRDNLAILR